MCINLNLQAVEIEVDAKVVHDWIHTTLNNYYTIHLLYWITQIPWVKMRHCFHEASQYAKALARKKTRIDLLQELVVLNSPPLWTFVFCFTKTILLCTMRNFVLIRALAIYLFFCKTKMH